MVFETLMYFILSSAFLAALPGPAMMLAIQGSVVGGWRQGVRITAGILVADAVLLSVVCLGIGGLMASSPRTLFILNIASSAYLLYLGVTSLLSVCKTTVIETAKCADWKEGLFVTLINPKTIVFLLAYLPQFIEPEAAFSEAVQLWILAGCFLVAVAVVMLAYSLSSHAARRWLSNVKVNQAMFVVFGLLLIGISINNLKEVV